MGKGCAVEGDQIRDEFAKHLALKLFQSEQYRHLDIHEKSLLRKEESWCNPDFKPRRLVNFALNSLVSH